MELINDSKTEAIWDTRCKQYPRPQFRRRQWQNLNGKWKFCFDDEARFQNPASFRPDPSAWNREIEVPFAPECARSGIGDQSFHTRLWYQKTFDLHRTNKRVILHFGAVDYRASVWVNDKFCGVHEGGHSSFHFDVTSAIVEGDSQTITVLAEDNPHDLAKPRGKQDWQLHPHSIWYPRTSGIWQTVWIECVPDTYIDHVKWTPILERWEIGCQGFVKNADGKRLQLRVHFSAKNHVLVNDLYEVMQGEVHRRIALSDPGIDDYRNELLWSPEAPTLIDARLELWENGELVDEVASYTALRSVAIRRDHFMLNGRPYYLRMVLDQGYWPESFMTAPDDEAFIRDIQLTKQMGFNGVRKHQKIEDPRYLYWADQMGLLVWEEMPSAYRFTELSVERVTREWMEIIARDYNHPCIIMWVPFNESWGVPDLEEKSSQQHCVQALYHLTKTLDHTRPVIGNDGWESTATDVIGIHDYDNRPSHLVKKYGPGVQLNDLLKQRIPAGRLVAVEGYALAGQPIMLTEFGGIAFSKKMTGTGTWGYSVCETERDFAKRLFQLFAAVQSATMFIGFCYTQLTDTFQEGNGLLYADRTSKIPIEALCAAVRHVDFEQVERCFSGENTGAQAEA